MNYVDPAGTNAFNPDSGGNGLCWGTAVYVDGLYWGCTGGIGGMPGSGGGGGGFCGGSYFAPTPDPSCYAPVPIYGGDGDDDYEPERDCDPQYRSWINRYGANAVGTGLNEADVLATSVIESGWGRGRFATEGNSFFNLETLWKPGTKMPAPKYAYQVSWIPANEPFASGPQKGKYSLVASYNSVADSFKSFAATLGTYLSGVTNAADFASILVAHGINAGRDKGFGATVQKFQDCLGVGKR